MTPLFPPDYPENPSAPLRGFGEAFAEEISRSCIAAVYIEEPGKPREGDVSVAAALTMFEGMHPRDHDECLMAVEIVAFHTAAMHSLGAAMQPGLSVTEITKLRSSAAQMARALSTVRDDLERKQGKPLPERPKPGPLQAEAPLSQPDGPPPPAMSEPVSELFSDAHYFSDAHCDASAETNELPPELLADMEIRPDGTLGSLCAYAPRLPKEAVIPTDLAIMWALATQPKPWRMLNEPGTAHPAPPPEIAQPDPPENTFRGDTLARFRSSPAESSSDSNNEAEESFVELELLSTGGDPELEAQRLALIAAHPEGRPAKMIRYSHGRPRDGLSGRT